jgi:hypothetical protein
LRFPRPKERILAHLPRSTPLPGSFRKYGFLYEQLDRTEHFAIYRQTRHGMSDFEVIRIRSQSQREVQGRLYRAGECYPSSAEWGRHGWTFTALGDAQRKLVELNSAGRVHRPDHCRRRPRRG